MANIRSGMLAGFLATFVASIMLLMNNALHAIPEVHIPQTLATIMGMPDRVMVGGILFLVIGTVVFGTIYALLAPRVPLRSNLIKGMLFGFVIWLCMMLIYMPLGGAGFFAVNRGPVAALATLVLTLVYGLILGAVYAWDRGSDMPAASKRNRGERQHSAT